MIGHGEIGGQQPLETDRGFIVASAVSGDQHSGLIIDEKLSSGTIFLNPGADTLNAEHWNIAVVKLLQYPHQRRLVGKQA